MDKHEKKKKLRYIIMKITIPTSLNEITCEQLHKITEVVKLTDNDTLLKMSIAAIVCHLPLDKVAQFDIKDINEISDNVLLMLEEKPAIEHFKIDGIEFGFIPNLEDMKGNEYLDIDLHMNTDIFKAMAVFYRPIKMKIGDSYKIEKYKGSDKYSELMKKAPASAYVAAKVFFWNLMTDLLVVTPNYLLKNLPSSEVALLERNGVGISQLTNSLEVIGSDLKRLLKN